MSAIEILTIVLLVFASALCIALIIYMGRITTAIKEIQNSLTKVSSDIQPLITSVSDLANNLSEITEDTKEQLEVSKSIVYSVRDRVDTILDLEEKVRGGIEEPITVILKSLKAFSNGVTAFLNYFKK